MTKVHLEILPKGFPYFFKITKHITSVFLKREADVKKKTHVISLV